MTELGRRIRLARETLEMKQIELARRARVTQATVSRVENDPEDAVRLGTIKRIAGALGVTTDYLLRGKGLRAEDVFRGDENARLLVELYTRLSRDSRVALIDFLRFLSEKKPSGEDKDLQYALDDEND